LVKNFTLTCFVLCIIRLILSGYCIRKMNWILHLIRMRKTVKNALAYKILIIIIIPEWKKECGETLTQRANLQGFLEQLRMKAYIWRNSSNMGTGSVQKTVGYLKNYGQVD
jgi:hypothetical protein